MDLIGRYPVVRKLATGGTSEVFLGRRPEGGPVALKRLFPHYAAHPAMAAMFQHEARVLAAMDHPAIPRALAHGRDGSTWFLAMEHVPGVDLATLVRAGPLPLEAALAAVLQLLEALDHAHSRRDEEGVPLALVHRDVTAANVLVTRDGAAKLIDFGLAVSRCHPGEPGGSLRGTVGYVAPEAITGESTVDARADLFAAGVVLYELTTGVRPFRGSVLEVMHAVVEGETPSPASERVGYPAALARVVQRALARWPEERFASALEMGEAVAAAARASGCVPSRAALGAVVEGQQRASDG